MDTRRRGRSLAYATGLGVMLALPGTAHAAVMSSETTQDQMRLENGVRLVYKAESAGLSQGTYPRVWDGEQNNLVTGGDSEQRRVEVADSGAGIRSEYGPCSVAEDRHSAVCGSSYLRFSSLHIDLGDRDDRIRVGYGTPAAQVRAGAGNDTVIDSSKQGALLLGDDGMDEIDTRDGMSGDRVSCGEGVDWALLDPDDALTDQSCEGQALAGAIASAPAAAYRSPSRLDVFARDSTGAFVMKSRVNGLWQQGWTNLGGGLTSDPAAVSWGQDRIDVFARAGSGELIHRRYADGKWSLWDGLGGELTSRPAVASWGPGRIDVFVRGTDSALWHTWYDGGHWAGWWEYLGGQLTSAPAATSSEPGRLDVFARGTDNQLYQLTYNRGWGSWTPRGGALASAPAVTSRAAWTLDVFALDANGGLMRRSFNEAGWADWTHLGGEKRAFLNSDPSAVIGPTGEVEVLTRGSEQTVQYLRLP